MNTFTATFILPLFEPRAEDPSRQVAAIWFQITDFASWEQWLPNWSKVAVLDTGEVGRGSRLQIKNELHTEQWQVSYWDADKRIVFQITQGQSHRACAMETRCRDDHAIDLVFAMEYEITGMRRLLRPILAWIYARRTRMYAENLRAWLLSKVPK